MSGTSRILESDSVVDSVFIDLVEQLAEQMQCGKSVDLDQLAQAYPGYVERLRRLLPAMQAAANLGVAHDAASEPVLPRDDLAVATKCLGEFRLIREIDRGGMGIVFEAEQVTLGRRVALKVLPFAAILDPRQLERFKNEAKAAATLHHTNIVPVYSVGCDRGVHYYAMQYIEGCSLATIVRRLREQEPAAGTGVSAKPVGKPHSDLEKPPESLHASNATDVVAATDGPVNVGIDTQPLQAFSTERREDRTLFFRRVAQLGRDAAEALDHAHLHSIVHRDIKPANLLLDVSGHVWVGDFGLARLETDTGITLSGDLLGTLPYMSPEQAQGDRHLIDPRSDIYSLGATLYEILTLQPVFARGDRATLLRQIAEQEPRSLRSIDPSLPKDLETIVLKTLQKLPRERYASARLLADDLQRFLDQKPIRAQRASVTQRVRKWANRHRALLTTAVLTLIATLALSSVLLWRAVSATRDALDLSEAHREAAEVNLRVVTDIARELAQLGHKQENVETLREAISIQEKAVDSITDTAAATAILMQMMHTHAHLAWALKRQGKLDEARQVCAEYWLSVDRRGVVLTDVVRSEEKGELLGAFLYFVQVSMDLSDWQNAERALRCGIQLAHERLRQPPSAEKQLGVIRSMAFHIAVGVDRVTPRVKNGESLVAEYVASADVARELLRQQAKLPVDQRQPELIASTQAYLAHVARLQGKSDEARALYHEALQSLPKTQSLPRPLWVSCMYQLADEYRRQGRNSDVVGIYREAAEQSRICVDIDPLDARFFENLVISLNEVYNNGNLDESRQACKEMLDRLRAERQRDPEFGKREDSSLLTALIQRQVLGPYTELYDYPEALACAEQLLEIDPQNQQAWLLLGLAKYRLQDYEGAREWLQKLNSVPTIEDLPKIYLLPTRMAMALTLQKLGKADMAHTYYKQGLAAYQGIADPGTEERAILEEAQRELAVSAPQP